MTSPFTIAYIWRPSRLGVSEGLNVLLTDLIRGLIESRLPVRILTTNRHIDGLKDVLSKNHIPDDKVIVVPVIRGSVVLKLRDFWFERFSRRKKREPQAGPSLLYRLRGFWEQLLAWVFDLHWYNMPFKLLCGIFILCLVMLGVPLVLPLLLLRKMIWHPSFEARIGRRLRSNFPKLKGLVVRALNGLIFPIGVMERLYQGESRRFAGAIDNLVEVKAIFIPAAFEGYLCAHIRRTQKLVVFPDATPLMFPTRFPGGTFSDTLLLAMRESVKNSSALVCYSNFVRDTQLRRFFATECAEKPIEVIPQGFFVDGEFGERGAVENATLNGYVRNCFPEYGAFPKVYFGEFSAIIYPTVDRPHKNTLTLLKAFDVLLRKRGRNVKLILTSPGGTADVMEFIRQRKLHRDVLFMPAVPIVILNHLLAASSVMVHPSLAEGGDIFNFSRAVSQGTPALLADIPVAREMFERNDFGVEVFGPWLFQPTDFEVLAEKIDQILSGVWHPLNDQRLALERLGQYRFADMARRYLDIFNGLVQDEVPSGR